MSSVAIITYPDAIKHVIAEREVARPTTASRRAQTALLADLFPREGVNRLARMIEIERDIEAAKSEADQDEYSGLDGKSVEMRGLADGQPYIVVTDTESNYVGAFALLDQAGAVSQHSPNGELIETTIFGRKDESGSVEYNPENAADLDGPLFDEGTACDPLRGGDPDLQAFIRRQLHDAHYDLAHGQSRN